MTASSRITKLKLRGEHRRFMGIVSGPKVVDGQYARELVLENKLILS